MLYMDEHQYQDSIAALCHSPYTASIPKIGTVARAGMHSFHQAFKPALIVWMSTPGPSSVVIFGFVIIVGSILIWEPKNEIHLESSGGFSCNHCCCLSPQDVLAGNIGSNKKMKLLALNMGTNQVPAFQLRSSRRLPVQRTIS